MPSAPTRRHNVPDRLRISVHGLLGQGHTGILKRQVRHLYLFHRNHLLLLPAVLSRGP